MFSRNCEEFETGERANQNIWTANIMPDTILLFQGKKRNRHAFGSFFLLPGQQNANCSETTIIYLVNSLDYQCLSWRNNLSSQKKKKKQRKV